MEAQICNPNTLRAEVQVQKQVTSQQDIETLPVSINKTTKANQQTNKQKKTVNRREIISIDTEQSSDPASLHAKNSFLID